MVNSISVVLFIVLLAVAAFSAAMGSYYYSTLSESLKQKAENAISSFDYYRTEAEYYDNARAVVAGEPNSNKMKIKYMEEDDQIRFSRSDLTAFRSPGTPDIAEAISMKRTKVWIGADPSTGEHIMAASSPLMIDGEVVGVMRYVTSLNKVDKQIIIIVAIALGIGLGILGVAGERRWRASRMAGLTEVPVIVKVNPLHRRPGGGHHGNRQAHRRGLLRRTD